MIIAGFGSSFQLQGRAGQRQIVKTKTACILEEAISGEHRFGPEEIAEDRRHQNCDRPVETGGEHTTAIRRCALTVECESTCQRAAAIGIERKINLQLIQFTSASQSEINRREAINVQEIGDNAIGRFRDFQVEIDLLVGIGISRAKREISARTIKTLDVETGIQRAIGKGQAAIGRDFRFKAKNIRPEMQACNIELVETDGNWQFRQAETRRFRRW